MLGQKIGRNIIPVVEKYTELGLILDAAEKLGVRPQIGMRVKLAARGSGRWQSSGGFRSKFGLTVTEIIRGLDELKARGMQDCLKLLHFHLGSQITNIRHVKTAVTEAARSYADLAKRGAGLEYLDIGGGLGVDQNLPRTASVSRNAHQDRLRIIPAKIENQQDSRMATSGRLGRFP